MSVSPSLGTKTPHCIAELLFLHDAGTESMDVSPLLLNEAVMPRFLTEAHHDSSSSINQKRDPRETVQTNRAIDP